MAGHQKTMVPALLVYGCSTSPYPTPAYDSQKPMSRSDSLALVEPQIVPGCSVYGRNGSPHFDWTASGTPHHSDVIAPSTAVRHVNVHALRQGASRSAGS